MTVKPQTFFFLRFYLFIFREMGRWGREISMCGWLSYLPGTRPATQARTLTGNWASDPLVHRLVLNPLSHTIQGKKKIPFLKIVKYFRADWCSSVDWAQACEAKGHPFDSQSEHMPGLQARSPVGGHVRGTHMLMVLSLSLSLPSPLSENKKLKRLKTTLT